MHTTALQTMLESLPPFFPSTEAIASMFGRYVADVGVAAHLSWNAEAGRKLAFVLRILGCEKLGRVHVRDANDWPTMATLWSNPHSRLTKRLAVPAA